MNPTRKKRRAAAQGLSCPICLKTFRRAMMSLSDFNDHVDKCTEAQFQYFAAKSASSASTSIRIKQKQDMKEKMVSSVEDEEKKARVESLKMLEQEGTVKDTFESMLLLQF